MSKRQLLLGSQSPRRVQLLEMLDIPFRVYTQEGISEELQESVDSEQVAEAIACLKAEQLKKGIGENDILVTADTVVVVEGRVLGKPHSEAEAVEMLQMLSGKTHLVITGVAISSQTKTHSFSCTTQVTFSHLQPKDIAYYINKYRPLDKAGAYGIQEWIGAVGISHIEGSFYNVMGLPIHRLYQELQSWL